MSNLKAGGMIKRKDPTDHPVDVSSTDEYSLKVEEYGDRFFSKTAG
jgi:hypothetical protein